MGAIRVRGPWLLLVRIVPSCEVETVLFQVGSVHFRMLSFENGA